MTIKVLTVDDSNFMRNIIKKALEKEEFNYVIPMDGDGEDKPEDIKEFIIKTVQNAGANACPPYVIGIGLGGTFDKAAYLSKKALLKEKSEDKELEEFESDILNEVNKTGIGPAGLGGKVTALDVKILTYPCHIASLPVAVNINCHAARHITITI